MVKGKQPKKVRQTGKFFRSRQHLTREPTPKKVPISRVASLRESLRTGNPRTLKNPSEVQGIQRFQTLTLKENKALIKDLASQYAKIFNKGFVAERVGLETYYSPTKGRGTFCFTSFNGIEKAPKLERSDSNGDSIVKRMSSFYKSIEMDDYQARAFFVQSFKDRLNKKMRYLFNLAIQH